MFYPFLRTLLFRFDAERVHDYSLLLLKLFHLSGLSCIIPPAARRPRTAMGLSFPNPVGLAAGYDKNGDCIDGLAALGFGFIEVGTVTPLPQPGNVRPRLFRISEKKTIINRMGFNNKGVDYLVGNLRTSGFKGVIGVNIGKNAKTPLDRAEHDYLTCLKKIYPHAGYVTVNISSPNTPDLRKLQMADHLSRLVSTLKKEQLALEKRYGKYVPLAVKLSPDMTDIQVETAADILLQYEMDGIIATNTTVSRPEVGGFKKAMEAGGLSGWPLKQRAGHILALLARRVGKKMALIATGGVMSADDARERIEIGADLIQVYTGLVYEGPAIVRNILEDIDWR